MVEEGMSDSITRSVERQREFFASGATRRYEFRLQALRTIDTLLADHETEILAALQEDLGKPAFEAYTGEILVVRQEARHAIRRLAAWMRRRPVSTSILHFPARSYVEPEPIGVSAIFAPWNFPFQLVMAPLVAALAAGNCAILKPSEESQATSGLIARLLAERFPPEHVCVMTGGAETAEALVASAVDHVFFTGSRRIGTRVAIECARRSIPVALELGCKNPCLIAEDADLALSVRRIAWGKFFNCGQSCVAPDYLLVPRGRKEQILDLFRQNLENFYGREPKRSGDYGRIINRTHLERLRAILQGTRILMGGGSDSTAGYLEPTLVESGEPGHSVWTEEIFGPILPIAEYRDREEALSRIASLPPPIAAYLFCRDPGAARQWAARIRCGSLVFNDTISQFLSATLPFGGFGASGNAKYHGIHGFNTFSHQRSVFLKSTRLDMPLRYPPYRGKLGILRLLRWF